MIFPLCLKLMRKNPRIAQSILEFVASPNRKFLFGAETQAAVCLGILRDMGVPIDGLLLDSAGDKARLNGFWGRLLRQQPLYRLATFPHDRERCDVLLTVDSSLYGFATKQVLESGFPRVYTCDWGSNMNLKNICYNAYISLREE